MRLKKTKTLIVLMACIFAFANYTVIKTSGAHPGSTGAPKDKTCAQQSCHSDATLTFNPVGTHTLFFSVPDSTYVPGQTYSFTLSVQKPLVDKFGFEIQALRNSDSTNIGQFIITDNVRTQILSHFVGADTRFSVTHEAAGTQTLSPNSNQWSFNWQAPPSNEGNITFYYATNCTNNDGAKTGDAIYLSSFTIKPKVTSVKELSDVHELKLFYDNETKEILINYDLKGNKKTTVKVFDSAGKLIFDGPTLKLSGKQKHTINLGNDHAKGAYLVQLGIDEQSASKKIIVY